MDRGVWLDDPARIDELRVRIQRKSALRRWYRECYEKYAACVGRCPRNGAVLEIGSGGGFVKEVLPDAITSDVIAYPGLDRVIDATRLPFGDGSLRAILMSNVFHHLADAPAFLAEAERCLVAGGRLFLVDQHVGWISGPILAHGHHEPFDADAKEWRFESSGPLASANGALTWIVFQRDRALLERRHPRLRLERYAPHSPLRYFLAGGLKPWSLLPGFAFPLATALDAALTRLSPELGSFVDVELVRT
jgi:SAM-dependent methyltransferase